VTHFVEREFNCIKASLLFLAPIFLIHPRHTKGFRLAKLKVLTQLSHEIHKLKECRLKALKMLVSPLLAKR
tara:strand:+ start:231090 stop:231302 length:213 start_codon:yes stop_codon:yes gene_type:complete